MTGSQLLKMRGFYCLKIWLNPSNFISATLVSINIVLNIEQACLPPTSWRTGMLGLTIFELEEFIKC